MFGERGFYLADRLISYIYRSHFHIYVHTCDIKLRAFEEASTHSFILLFEFTILGGLGCSGTVDTV